jgi:hypothetical protein
MASSGNFATWNPLTIGSRASLADGNLTMKGTSVDLVGVTSTIGITSGKWYWEIYIARGYDTYMYAGINSGYEGGGFYSGYAHLNGMTPSAIRIRNNGTLSDSSSSDDPDRWGTITLDSTNVQTFDDTDILMFALDYDNKKLWIGKNGTFMNSGNPAGGSNQQASWTGDVPIIYPAAEPYYTNNNETANFGQDSSFAGNKTSGSANATDANGFGNFYYTPPSSGDTKFLALCSANLPISDDIDPAQTDDDFPSKQFNVVTYTGNGSTVNVTGVGFQPDLVWIKMRSPHTYNNMMFDSNRGVYKSINSDRTNLEYNLTDALSSFDSDGFTYGNEPSGNDSGDSFVAWCWRANGGTTSSNSDGSITTTLQVGKGFSIGTYTGTGSNATVGHGLGAVPDFTLFKRRDASGNWVATSQKNMASNDHNLYLQLSNAESDGNYFQNTAMTSSVISIGTHADINGSSNTYVMYNWINVEGFQKFGKYTGNGNADGAFIYTGFRPALIFLKRTDSSGSWLVHDDARDTFNPVNEILLWNTNDVEFESGDRVDFLSNGFKLRNSNTGMNGSGNTYIYGAWGSVPFKYNNSF